MNEPNESPIAERPDSFWYRVYAGVVATTVVVIALLYAFTEYFSS